MGRRRGILPALAILVLVAAVASDVFIAGYWASHPMLTAIVSEMAVALVSVAVIERRDERRWRVLANYALVDLTSGANTVWVRLAGEPTALGGPIVMRFDPRSAGTLRHDGGPFSRAAATCAPQGPARSTYLRGRTA